MKFRKTIAAVAALCLAAPAVTGGLTATATQPIGKVVAGDVNVDYVFNLADIVVFQRWLRGDDAQELFPAYGEPGPGADVNEDKSYDIYDLVGMRKLLVKAITNAPVPSYAPTARNLCAGIEKDPWAAGSDIDKEFISSQTKFTVGLFKATYNENKGQNDLVSPYSVMQALAMTANGANGETLEEMQKVLGDGMTIDRLNRYLLTQRKSTVHEGDFPKWALNTANSIWTRNDESSIQVRPEFIQNCVDYYDSEYYLAPFDESTITDVNNWVNDKTNEMIPSILQEIYDDDVMFLVNAVAFEAEWDEQYSKYSISDGKFTAADGTVQDAQMLTSWERYLHDENTEGMMKYYSGQNYAFAAFMPDENTSIDTYIEELTPEKLSGLLSSYKNKKHETVQAKLPKFKYEYANEITDELKAMGMPTAFSDKADFSNMSSITDVVPIHIGYVAHKTFIDLDENGTKAAAATMVAMTKETALMMPEKELVFDRPFVYCIFDTETCLPIFIGALNSLE